MNRWISAFFMTWGMFLAIPCPFRRWDEGARPKMMVCLPLVGGIVGGLWALAAWALPGLPPAVYALVLAAVPWLATGFLHLDGFMDVCDAVLSRRDLETRRKILKDSHCGAFAVICLGLLLLAQWCLFFSAGEIPLLPLALIPVAVRACAGFAVLTLRPLAASQYTGLAAGNRSKKIALAAMALAASCSTLWMGTQGLAPLAGCLGYWAAAWYGCKQLGGISGDISGFALTLGEFTGVAVLILTR